MRKFERREPPANWKQNEEKWNRQWVELLQKNPKAKFAWYASEGQTARDIALPELKAQTSEHCSFCDGFPVDNVSLDTIEHFRPKCAGRFPENAYTWNNLYYCCNRCQAHKGEQWDVNLIAPDAPGHEFGRYFEFDFTTGAIRPSTVASPSDQSKAQITIIMYGLDTDTRRRFRRLELKKWSDTKAEDRSLDVFAYRNFVAPEK